MTQQSKFGGEMDNETYTAAAMANVWAEIDRLTAENERLRELIEGRGLDPDIILRNKRDAEKYREIVADD